MPTLNPNHPVTQAIDTEFLRKMCAVLVMKLGGRAEVTADDLHALSNMFEGETPTLVTHAHARSIEFRLIPESEGLELAREVGGMPC